MIVIMEAGIKPGAQEVLNIVAKAESYGLLTDVRVKQGTHFSIVEIYLLDGRVRSCTLSEHIFQLPGVASVQRVTPSTVTFACHSGRDPHHLQLGTSYKVGFGLPCQPILGPCTVDKNIDEIVLALTQHGIKMIRGGCWKPRSSAYSFRGFGANAVRWLLKAAARYEVEVVFIEVIESKHIEVVRELKQAVGYTGTVALWIGARSAGNSELHTALGEQHEFPVMIKNSIYDRGIRSWLARAEFVLAGPMYWRDDGTLDEERSLPRGNNQVMLCVRGTEQLDPDSPLRFSPNHSWIETLHQQCWAPVVLDPSHSAGTMRNDLVLRNLAAGLAYGPDAVMVEVYLDGLRALCDAEQAVPLSRVPEILEMIERHNKERFSASK